MNKEKNLAKEKRTILHIMFETFPRIILPRQSKFRDDPLPQFDVLKQLLVLNLPKQKFNIEHWIFFQNASYGKL
jgi:hypothetical protein